MEYQCRPHSGDYSMHGLSSLRIWREIDPSNQKLISFRTHTGFMGMERIIWMDGRPHPPEWADHTWQGFSTGTWDGNMLTIVTTHLKPGYTKRNGIPSSDKRTITEHWTMHGNYLTAIVVDDDPVFLSEPLIRSSSWVRDPNQRIGPAFCEPAPEVPHARGHGAASLARHESLSNRSRRLVRSAGRSHPRGRGNHVSRISPEDGQAAFASAAEMRTFLRLHYLGRLPADGAPLGDSHEDETGWFHRTAGRRSVRAAA
jgi:hypothetical protein